MEPIRFTLTEPQFRMLMGKYPNLGNNSDIGKFAVEIAKLYFQSIHANVQFPICTRGGDITVCIGGNRTDFGVKGTADDNIAYQKLKVSSMDCYNSIVNGMPIMRITQIGSRTVSIFFLKHGEHFRLIPEPRWRLQPIRN